MISYLPFRVTAFANSLSEPSPEARVRPPNDQATRPRRDIGPLGTATRLCLGCIMVGSVVYGQIMKGPFQPLSWVIGLLVFPALSIIWQYLRTRRHPARLVATGPVAAILNAVIFFALYFTFLYAPAIAFLSDAALLFYGLSMLLAALRGYGGCEVLAISNWLLKCDDQVGCLVFSPIDSAERKMSRRPRTTKDTG
ncbi:MAG: hypothetical protein JOZ18_11100 [Chloroflexi bacterium]|nr:hypothetical protein [Chloroflexota bacterium]